MKRRLSVIMSADVAGYSRLVASDEEGTVRRFRDLASRVVALVQQHDGRVFNTAGDAILAEFNSAVSAVRCATDIQEATRSANEPLPENTWISFRIGIAIGDVIVTETGDLLGDGVNIAARLQGLADNGGICLSQEVHDHVASKVGLRFVDLGMRELKNIPRPVRAFRISGIQAVLPVQKQLVQRQRSLVVLAVLTLAAAGAAASWWVIQTSLRQTPHSPTQAGSEEQYSGQICYGQSENEGSRCYVQEGTLQNRTLSGRWHARDPGTTMILAGTADDAGAITIEMHTEGLAGERLQTIRLSGSVKDGNIIALGSFLNGRSVTLNWHRIQRSP
jgi:class 3 adenylate cyclase